MSKGNKIKFFIEQSWLLIVASFVFGSLLAYTNAAWKPRIEQNAIDKFNNEAIKMLSDAVKFETPEAVAGFKAQLGKGKTADANIKRAVNANNVCVGWAFIAQGPGFADKIQLVVTVDAKFEKLQGYGVLFSNETPGFGDKIKNDFYLDQFVGTPTTNLTLLKAGDATVIDETIIAITGATVTSDALVKIFNNYIPQIKAELESKGLLQ